MAVPPGLHARERHRPPEVLAQPDARRWWVFELKRGRAADSVVGQVSRYLGWIAEERRGHRESVVGTIIVKRANPKLRYAVKAHERLNLGLNL